eukprot:2468203-Prymnesium_polylepis.1
MSEALRVLTDRCATAEAACERQMTEVKALREARDAHTQAADAETRARAEAEKLLAVAQARVCPRARVRVSLSKENRAHLCCSRIPRAFRPAARRRPTRE